MEVEQMQDILQLNVSARTHQKWHGKSNQTALRTSESIYNQIKCRTTIIISSACNLKAVR